MDWKRFFDSLGLNGTRWQWRMMRWQQTWEDWRAKFQGNKQTIQYRHKFCSSCGALLDRDENTCPQCGERAQSWKRQSVARAAGLMMPTASIATPALLIVNIAIMILMMLRFGSTILFEQPFDVMLTMGGLAPASFFDGEYWRLITYGYLHYGLVHIAFNMFALSQVGPMLENEIGSARFFSVYTLALIGGGVPNLFFRATSPVPIAGASGALFGLIGFGAAYCHFAGGTLKDGYRNFFLTWALYGFIFGAVVRANNLAHAGGLVVGMVLGNVLARERRHHDRFTTAWQSVTMILLLTTLGAYAWMVIEKGGHVPTYFLSKIDAI